MNRRPMPIVLLAIFQFLTPVFNLAVNSFAFHVAPTRLLQDLIATQPTRIVLEFLILGPLAGFAIFSFRRWSYGLFLACMVWSIATNFVTWRQHPELVSLGLLLGVTSLSVALCSYFFLPAVRAAYWYPSVRWWESRPRFRADGDLSVTTSEGRWLKAFYRNVSEGGLFVEAEPGLAENARVQVAFTIGAQRFECEARIAFVSNRVRGGYGLQLMLASGDRKRMRAAVRDLEAQGAPRITPKPRFVDDFRAWAKELRTTGHGLVPELSDVAKAKMRKAG